MLDEKDIKILNELKKNARQKTKTISEKTKIPRVTTHERIQKMVENGIIKKFTILPDYTKIGLPFKAFIFISLEKIPNVSQRTVAYQVAQLSEVYEVHIISGEYDLLIKVRGKSLDEISKLVIDKLRIIKGVGGTLTMTVFETMKEEP